MKEFFAPEDFPSEVQRCGQWPEKLSPDIACNLANAKLKRHGMRVYGHADAAHWLHEKLPTHTHTALLVCIELIAKCEHSAEKHVGGGTNSKGSYVLCGCGTKLKQVITYEEII